MCRHGWYAKAGAYVEARVCGEAYGAARGQVRVLLRGAGGPLVAGEIHPDAITHREVLDALPERVDHTHTVLVGTTSGNGGAAPEPRRDFQSVGLTPETTMRTRTSPGLVRSDRDRRAAERRVTRTRVDDRFHVRDNRVILLIIPSQVGAVR